MECRRTPNVPKGDEHPFGVILVTVARTEASECAPLQAAARCQARRGSVTASSVSRYRSASCALVPHISSEALSALQTFGRPSHPHNAQRRSAVRCGHRTPAGFGPAMPGITEEMEGAIQHAPQPARQSIRRLQPRCRVAALLCGGQILRARQGTRPAVKRRAEQQRNSGRSSRADHPWYFVRSTSRWWRSCPSMT
jgi:hypothetical protein